MTDVTHAAPRRAAVARCRLAVEERVDLLLAEMTLAEKVGQTHQVANIDPERRRRADRAPAGSARASTPRGADRRQRARRRACSSATSTPPSGIAVEGSRLGIPLLFGRDVIHGHRTVVPDPARPGRVLRRRPRRARRRPSRPARPSSTASPGPSRRWSTSPRSRAGAGSPSRSARRPVLVGPARRRARARASRATTSATATGSPPAPSTSPATASPPAAATTTPSASARTPCATCTCGRSRPPSTPGSRTVMAAFNDVDGMPMHAHRHLIREVLKGEWGFDGVVVADWNGVGQLVNQGVAADLREAAALAILAGVDLDMVLAAPTSRTSPELVESGEVDLALVDDAVRRVLRLKFRLGLFERPYAARPGCVERADPRDPRGRAREAGARPSHVLRQERRHPAARHGQRRPARCCSAAPFVDEGDALLGTWVLDGRGEDVVIPGGGPARAPRRPASLVSRRPLLRRRRSMQAAPPTSPSLLARRAPARAPARRIGASDIGLPAGPARGAARSGRARQAARGRRLHRPPAGARPGARARRRGARRLAPRRRGRHRPGRRAARRRRPQRPAADDLPALDGPHPDEHAPAADRAGSSAPTSTTSRAATSTRSPTRALPFGLRADLHDVRATAHPRSVVADCSPRRRSITADGEVTNTGERAGREVVQLYFRDPVAEVTRPLVELTDWRARRPRARADAPRGHLQRRPAGSSAYARPRPHDPASTRARSTSSSGPTRPGSSPCTTHGEEGPMIEIHAPPDPASTASRRIVMAGEVHYFRVAARRVGAPARPARRGGCNTVASYIPWLFHELPDGSIDVTGRTRPERDVGAFIDLCRRARPAVHRPARAVHHGRAEERGPARTGSTATTPRSSRSAGTAGRRRPGPSTTSRPPSSPRRPLVRRGAAGARRRGCSPPAAGHRRPAGQRDRHAGLGHATRPTSPTTSLADFGALVRERHGARRRPLPRRRPTTSGWAHGRRARPTEAWAGGAARRPRRCSCGDRFARYVAALRRDVPRSAASPACRS